MRPCRFRVNVWGAASRTAWQDKVRKVEDLGYATLTVPDHLGGFVDPLSA